MRKNLIVIVFVVLFLDLTYARASEDIFQLQGARPMAMGGAFIAVSDDYNAITYNPAGLARSKQKNIGYDLSYQNYDISYPLAELSYYNLNQSLHYCFQNFGFQLASIEDGDQESIYTKINYEEISETKDLSKFYIGYIGFGKMISDNISWGLTAKAFSANNKFFLDKPQKGLAFNIGSIVKINPKLSAGVLLENAGATNRQYVLHGYDGSFLGLSELPLKTDIGLSYRTTNKFLLALDVRNIFESKVSYFTGNERYTFKRSYHLGGEYPIAKNLALRGGISRESQLKMYQETEYKNILTYSGGIGITRSNSTVDFYISFADLDRNESFSATTPFKIGGSVNLDF